MKFRSCLAFAVFALILFSPQAKAQCRSFAKKKCLPNLAPFKNNGKMNATIMRQGQVAELAATFFSGQNYRVMICAQPALGDVIFKVLDAKTRNVLFNSGEHDVTYWDFKVKTTSEVLIEVTVPENDSPNALEQSGCVTILVGFKP